MLGVAGSFPRLLPPSGASWTRSGSNPLISPALSWEETAVVEMVVILEDGVFKMWFRGGWNAEAIGYATSADGIHWTKYAGNPVYGLGGSGEAASVALPEIRKVGSTYYLFAIKHPFGIGGTNSLVVATSTDGITWTPQTASISLPSGKTLWGNRVVWREGSTWKMLNEAGPSTWEMYLYTSSDGLTWSIQNSGNPLTTLQVHAGGAYGGPTFPTQDAIVIPKRNGVYELFYHAAPVSGNQPSHIYRATSSDLITWTQTGGVLIATGSGEEIDQIADPSVIVAGSVAYLYYDTTINATETGKIMLATGLAVV